MGGCRRRRNARRQRMVSGGGGLRDALPGTAQQQLATTPSGVLLARSARREMRRRNTRWCWRSSPRTHAHSYLRLIDSCITQLKAQGSCRTCNESKEEEARPPPNHHTVPHTAQQGHTTCVRPGFPRAQTHPPAPLALFHRLLSSAARVRGAGGQREKEAGGDAAGCAAGAGPAREECGASAEEPRMRGEC